MIKSAVGSLEKISPELAAPAERGADSERRAAIIDCAEQVFLDKGFEGASMAEIAQRSECAKGTLYNYFASKEELFLACVARQCASLQAEMSTLTSAGGAIRQTLAELGRRYATFVTSEDIVRKFRMIVAEAERAPELSRAFYATGPARGAATLAAYIEAAMRDGLLAPGDPLRAARHFLALCNTHSKARLCNAEPAPDAATIARDVEDAVRVFMAAYGA